MLSNKDLKYVILSIFLLLSSITFVKNTFVVMENKHRLESLEHEVIELEKDKAYIQESLAFQQSPEYIEQQARNKLNLVLPNEQTYVYEGSVENKNPRVLGDYIEEEVTTEKSNPRLWFELIF